MVYCSKCGNQNDDRAEYCSKCGANLQTGTQISRRYRRRKAEQECFGLPHGGSILGLAIGILVLLWGVFTLADSMDWIEQTPSLWFVILIIFGVLLIAGAIYGISRRKTSEYPTSKS